MVPTAGPAVYWISRLKTTVVIATSSIHNEYRIFSIWSLKRVFIINLAGSRILAYPDPVIENKYVHSL